MVDRRTPKDRRKSGERRKETRPVAVERRKTERRKVPRRRQIDPTTCERDYSKDEIEFMQALDAYKRANGRMFPTCSEILEVIRDMGYVRIPAPRRLPERPASTTRIRPTRTASARPRERPPDPRWADSNPTLFDRANPGTLPPLSPDRMHAPCRFVSSSERGGKVVGTAILAARISVPWRLLGLSVC